MSFKYDLYRHIQDLFKDPLFSSLESEVNIPDETNDRLALSLRKIKTFYIDCDGSNYTFEVAKNLAYKALDEFLAIEKKRIEQENLQLQTKNLEFNNKTMCLVLFIAVIGCIFTGLTYFKEDSEKPNAQKTQSDQAK